MKTGNYQYLIVGAGLFGSIFAHEAARKGHRCLVIDKRDHIGGNLYTYQEDGITVHQYGAHIFHTDSKEIWAYMNRFADFIPFTNQVLANYQDQLYNLPFNMNTFYQLWGVRTPAEAQEEIKQQIESAGITGKPKNLEEQAIQLVGTDIYRKLIAGYTQKQWGKPPSELPSFIIRRLPIRFTYDNNYFNHRFQGIPKGGYTPIFQKLLDDDRIDVCLKTDFEAEKAAYLARFPKIIYTGPIDAFFDQRYGPLEYRSLRFETTKHPSPNLQGNPVINYTDEKIPFTRSMEWKHFDKQGESDTTILTKEYPSPFTIGAEPYYPINDEKNNQLYKKYKQLAAKQPQVLFGGRLGSYRYLDMDQIVSEALKLAQKELTAN